MQRRQPRRRRGGGRLLRPDAGQSEIILPAWVLEVGFELTVNGTPTTPVFNARGNRLIIPAGLRGPMTLEVHVNGEYPFEARNPKHEIRNKS